MAGLAAARCGNFQLQLTTSPASQWKLEVRSWKLGAAIAILGGPSRDRIADNLRQPSAIARRFCTRSPVAGLAAARCGNFQLQLTTSLTSWWKLEVR